MSSYLLQPWTTQGSAVANANQIQDEEEWLPVDDFLEAVYLIDVSSTTVQTNTQLMLFLETAPSKDEGLFTNTCPPVFLNLLPTNATTVVRTLRASQPGLTTSPLAKWLRWRLSGTGSSWSATFRIRCKLLRETSFVPTDISGCVLWLRADAGITIASGTSLNVSGWLDLSGISSGASQNTAADQPHFQTGQMNGCPALFANGTSTYMSTPSITFGAGGASIFVAVQPNTSTEGSYARVLETEYSNGYFVGVNSAGSAYKLIVNDGTSPYGNAEAGTVKSGTNTIVVGTYNPSSTTGTVYVYAAGQASAQASNMFTAPSNQNQPFYLMSAYTVGEYWAGYLGEAIVYDRPLSASELTRVQRYLGARYGILVP